MATDPSRNRHASQDQRRRRRTGQSRMVSPRGAERADWFEVAPVAVLLVLALVFGGSAEPLSDMMVRIASLLVLAILAARLTPADVPRLVPAIVVAAAIGLVALVQLVPLPYALWRTLPGRAPFADLLDALRLGGAARSLSLDPEATRATLIAVLPALAAFVAVLVAQQRSVRVWIVIVIGGALATALIGGFQVAGYRQFYFYSHSNFGQLTGVFANRNHASDLLLVGIALLAMRFHPAYRLAQDARLIVGALIALLTVAVLLTISRFGIALLGIELVGLGVLLAPPRRRVVQGGVVVALAVAAAFLLILFDHRIAGTFGRFGSLADDLRGEIWGNTLYAAGQFWPVGSGLGTFVPVYSMVEQLDTMPTSIVNHAHNEYLELTLELGILGPILMLGYLIALIAAFVRAERRGANPACSGAAIGVAVLLAHSTNEFPLRNAALMVVFGLLNGIVFAAAQQKTSRARSRSVSE